MKEELITFETAKLAKEKGFYLPPVEFGDHYDEDGNYLCESDEKYYEQVLFTASTQSLLQRWLRERKVLVEVSAVDSWDSWICRVFAEDAMAPFFEVYTSKEYETYEEALEKGLKEGLKLI